MSKPIDQAAVSFLTEHASFKSSTVFAAIQPRFLAATTNGNDFFEVPLREKLLSFEKSLLWVAFVHALAPHFTQPLDTARALTKVIAIYDIDVENAITFHTLEDPESEEESEEGATEE